MEQKSKFGLGVKISIGANLLFGLKFRFLRKTNHAILMVAGAEQGGEINLPLDIITDNPLGLAGADAVNFENCKALAKRWSKQFPALDRTVTLRMQLKDGRNEVEFLSLSGPFLEHLQSVMSYGVNCGRLKMRMTARSSVENTNMKLTVLTNHEMAIRDFVPCRNEGGYNHNEYRCPFDEDNFVSGHLFRNSFRLHLHWELSSISIWIEGLHYDSEMFPNSEILRTSLVQKQFHMLTIEYECKYEDDPKIEVCPSKDDTTMEACSSGNSQMEICTSKDDYPKEACSMADKDMEAPCELRKKVLSYMNAFQPFSVSGTLICAESPVFAKMLSTDESGKAKFKEGVERKIILPDTTKEEVTALLEFLHSGPGKPPMKPLNDPSLAVTLMEMGIMYDFARLRNIMKVTLANLAITTYEVEDVLRLSVMARGGESTELKQLALDILRQFKEQGYVRYDKMEQINSNIAELTNAVE